MDLFINQSSHSIQSMLNINSLAPCLLMISFKDKLKAIINVDSVSATLPLPYHSLYSGTKGFLRELSLNSSLETNIDILTLSPGAVNTKMTGFAGTKFPNPLISSTQRTV